MYWSINVKLEVQELIILSLDVEAWSPQVHVLEPDYSPL